MNKQDKDALAARMVRNIAEEKTGLNVTIKEAFSLVDELVDNLAGISKHRTNNTYGNSFNT